MSSITEFLDTIIAPENLVSETKNKPSVNSAPESKIIKPTPSVESKLKTSTKSKPETRATKVQKLTDSSSKKSELNKNYYEKNKTTIQNKKSSRDKESRSKRVVLKEELKQLLQQLPKNILVTDTNNVLLSSNNKKYKFTYHITLEK